MLDKFTVCHLKSMIQRRTLSENLISSTLTRPSTMGSKFTIKERKAAKRKEKSRVAAQIRRNKESQTLILLQNALPLALPSPSQMLEKSIVIRIAGQTLFLMNTLDQVLGIDGYKTIPLISNNFLTFFVDSTGQIVYVSPNIQLLLEQHHWSNLIGMSISEVIDFKSRWPTIGEVVRMKLSSNNAILTDSSLSLSSSSTSSTPNSSRTSIASRLNLRKNSQAWNYSSSTCSLFNVWSCSNINHTNSKLRLLILQATQIKSSALNNSNSQHDTSKHLNSVNTNTIVLERSISGPPILNPPKKEHHNSLSCVQSQQGPCEPIPSSSKCMYQKMITTAHDKFYNFKFASTEFCQLFGESSKALVDLNFLEIVYLEDVIKIKSILDIIIKNNDSHIWTPIYRIMCKNGGLCVVKTLAKQYCTASSHSLILNHLIIRSLPICEHSIAHKTNEDTMRSNTQEKFISLSSGIKMENKKMKIEHYLIRSNTENAVSLKRKSNDKKRIASCERYPGLVDRTSSTPVLLTNIFLNSAQTLKLSPSIHLLTTSYESKLHNEMLSNDPFLPMDLEKYSNSGKISRDFTHGSFDNSNSKAEILHTFKSKLPQDYKFDHSSNRSPSYSLESCVLTSPGSESTDVQLDDQFVWDVSNNFQENNPLNYCLEEQYQNELEFILPI